MKPRFRTKRVDTNQKVIVNIFKLHGLSVLDLSAVGQGCPDILVAAKNEKTGHSITVLVEIKNPNTPDKQYHKNLNPQQQKFYDNWKGKIFIVRTAQEAEELSKKLKELL